MISKAVAFRRGRNRPAFTLVELLVVVGVITVLAAITMPVLLKSFRTGHTVRCVSNLGQLTRSNIAYTKDFNMLLVSGGNRSGEHDTAAPVYDGPWDHKWDDMWNTSSPAEWYGFWYEALQPYTCPGTGMPVAAESYNDRVGTTYSPTTTNRTQRDYLRDELGKLCGVYTCPAKKQCNLGYGYNYAAVYGVSGIWKPANEPAAGNEYFPHFKWYTWYKPTNVIQMHRSPIMRHHDHPDQLIHQPVPVLWYGQNIPASALLTPSSTIAFCDTGWITNDPDPVDDPLPADEWEEDDRSNITGYCRFPLDVGVNDQVYINGVKYKTVRPWRPTPRHGGKTCIGNFDGSARIVHIQDVIGFPYGHPKSLFSNVAVKAPPLSPWQ